MLSARKQIIISYVRKAIFRQRHGQHRRHKFEVIAWTEAS